MPYALRGRNVLVTGGSRGLGAVICDKFAAEGCNIAINYHSNAAAAAELSEALAQKYAGIQTVTIQGDCASAGDNARLVATAVSSLGGLDVVIANAGWTRFASWEDLHDLALEEWDRCWRANVLSQLVLMQAAAPVLKANAGGGAFIVTSSVAGVSTAGSSMGYSVSKAAGLHLMRCLAATQGPKIRVNAVCPGLLLTEWGRKFGDERIRQLRDRAVLRATTDLDDCADVFVMLARNASLTGQEIVVDAGLRAAAR